MINAITKFFRRLIHPGIYIVTDLGVTECSSATGTHIASFSGCVYSCKVYVNGERIDIFSKFVNTSSDVYVYLGKNYIIKLVRSDSNDFISVG